MERKQVEKIKVITYCHYIIHTLYQNLPLNSGCPLQCHQFENLTDFLSYIQVLQKQLHSILTPQLSFYTSPSLFSHTGEQTVITCRNCLYRNLIHLFIWLTSQDWAKAEASCMMLYRANACFIHVLHACIDMHLKLTGAKVTLIKIANRQFSSYNINSFQFLRKLDVFK